MIGYNNLIFRIKKIFRKLKIIDLDRDLILYKLKEKFRRVLDIGCGDGKFLEKLLEKGITKEAYGVDIGNTYRGNKIKFLKGNAEERLPFPDEFFDAIFCFHLLEHLKNPEKCIKEAKRILKKNGKIFVLVPKEIFHGSSAILDSILMSMTKRKSISPKKIHIHKFDRKKLKSLFRKWKDLSIMEIKRNIFLGKSYLVIATK